MHGNRDFGIRDIVTRKDHCCYGMGLGVIITDEVYLGFPGDVRNASAWPYPMQYEIAEDVDYNDLIFNKNQEACLEPIIRGARKLEKMGCRAISAECGFYVYFQKEKAAADFLKVAKRFNDQNPNMGPWSWNAPASRPLPGRSNASLISRSSAYATLFDFAYSVVAHRDFYGHV